MNTYKILVTIPGTYVQGLAVEVEGATQEDAEAKIMQIVEASREGDADVVMAVAERF